MGTIYFIGCNDCKVKRDLDKFYTPSFGVDIETRKEMLNFAKSKDSYTIEKDTFRCALLVSFLAKHKEHNCIFFDENNDELYDRLKDEEIDFWKESSNDIK